VLSTVLFSPVHLQLRKFWSTRLRPVSGLMVDRLHSEPFLSKYYAVSRATVRQALHALRGTGLIRKEKGRGAFVNRTSSARGFSSGQGGCRGRTDSPRRDVESTVLRACVERLPDWAADVLQLGRGAEE